MQSGVPTLRIGGERPKLGAPSAMKRSISLGSAGTGGGSTGSSAGAPPCSAGRRRCRFSLPFISVGKPRGRWTALWASRRL
eukprot:scaffold77099_cov30-Tisochrysis_lutea.AAC.4